MYFFSFFLPLLCRIWPCYTWENCIVREKFIIHGTSYQIQPFLCHDNCENITPKFWILCSINLCSMIAWTWGHLRGIFQICPSKFDLVCKVKQFLPTFPKLCWKVVQSSYSGYYFMFLFVDFERHYCMIYHNAVRYRDRYISFGWSRVINVQKCISLF